MTFSTILHISLLNFSVYCFTHTHTRVLTFTSLLPLLGSGFQFTAEDNPLPLSSRTVPFPQLQKLQQPRYFTHTPISVQDSTFQARSRHQTLQIRLTFSKVNVKVPFSLPPKTCRDTMDLLELSANGQSQRQSWASLSHCQAASVPYDQMFKARQFLCFQVQGIILAVKWVCTGKYLQAFASIVILESSQVALMTLL